MSKQKQTHAIDLVFGIDFDVLYLVCIKIMQKNNLRNYDIKITGKTKEIVHEGINEKIRIIIIKDIHIDHWS